MELTLGGKVITLKNLTLNDWIKAEDLGLDMRRLPKAEDFKFSHIRTMVYVVLSAGDKTITLDWVGEQLNESNMNEVTKTVTDFFTRNSQSAEVKNLTTTTSSEESTAGAPTI